MKTLFLCAAALVLACSSSPAQMPGSVSEPAALASRLRQMEGSLDAKNASPTRAALPSAWRARTSEGDYSISTAPLAAFLDARSVADARTWLDRLATQLDSYGGPDVHSSAAQAQLGRILARPEFAGNAPPSAWQRFWARVFARIERWIKSLFALAGAHPTASALFFWCALAGVVSLLAFFLFRLFGRGRYTFKLSGAPLPGPVRTSQQWLSAARAASHEGDLRKAIQRAYWAGVARLQESRSLPESATHTPREYLRLLSSPQQEPALRTLTAQLERVWYARATATPDDFSVCLGSLEALGCQVD